MFDLYKKRDFSAYFSDTISFFKSFGKHYFKNYFTINGIFLLILVVLIYFISKFYMETIFSSIGSKNGNGSYLLSYINENTFLIIGVLLFFVLLLVFLSLLNITYPIVYLQLIEKTGGANFSINEIITGIKENIGRLFLFFLGSIFVITPILILLFGVLVLLCFIIIGIPLFFIAIPSVISWLSLSYYEFIIKKTGFFTALGNGFNLVKQDFWTTIGTTFVMALLLQIIQGFITMIPYIIGVASMLVSSKDSENNSNPYSGISVLFAAIMVLSILMSYFFNNFQLINQGLIYYSLREQNENNSTKSQIDLIGTEIE